MFASPRPSFSPCSSMFMISYDISFFCKSGCFVVLSYFSQLILGACPPKQGECFVIPLSSSHAYFFYFFMNASRRKEKKSLHWVSSKNYCDLPITRDSSTILQSGEEPREYPGKRHWMKLLVDKKVKETTEKIRKYLEIYELTGIQSRFQMTTRVQHG